MAWLALNCPQCGAPLPRVALWRAVNCGSCGALIAKSESIVSRADFKQALARMRSASDAGGRIIECAGRRYALAAHLGSGDRSEVHLARRLGALPLLATLKLSGQPDGAAPLQREAEVLRELHATAPDPAAGYVAQCLPTVIACGPVENEPSSHALVLKHPTGYWGSLAEVSARFPRGIDPRHAVWIWRRMLDILKFLHAAGWSHGDIRPEHALVHPADHGVRIIGWARAQPAATGPAQTADLMRSARVIQVLLRGSHQPTTLPGNVPDGLSALLDRAGDDEAFCRAQGPAGLDSLLKLEARNAFGPPTFLPLVL